MKRTAIVIGGGLAGLATAAKLAFKGYSVTLLEKNNTVGGRARTFESNGYLFDMGPSWYMMPEVIENFFTSVGKKVSDYYELIDLKTKYRIFSDNHTPIDIVSHVQTNLKLFESLEPGSRKVLVKILADSKKAYEISLKLLSRAYFSIYDFLQFDTIVNALKLLLLFNPFQSYSKYINNKIKHPLLQKMLQFYTVFLGGSPYSTPALYSILIAADYAEKIWYPLGGMGELPRALQRICAELGVEIKLNTEVTSLVIDSESKNISQVISGKERFSADVVVNTADYAYFDTKILPKEYREYSEKYWNSREYAISSVLIYLGVSKKLTSLTHHNFYFQSDWSKHFSTIKNTSDYPENPCYYVCAPSVTDELVAPQGKENLFVLVPISVKTKTSELDHYVTHVLQHIEETIGEPFIEDIDYKRVFAQKDFEADYNAYKGNGLGLAHTLLQSVLLRPRMKSKTISNLYYAGQFTQPGIGVPMVLLSAEYVVKEIEKNESK